MTTFRYLALKLQFSIVIVSLILPVIFTLHTCSERRYFCWWKRLAVIEHFQLIDRIIAAKWIVLTSKSLPSSDFMNKSVIIASVPRCAAVSIMVLGSSIEACSFFDLSISSAFDNFSFSFFKRKFCAVKRLIVEFVLNIHFISLFLVRTAFIDASFELVSFI